MRIQGPGGSVPSVKPAEPAKTTETPAPPQPEQTPERAAGQTGGAPTLKESEQRLDAQMLKSQLSSAPVSFTPLPDDKKVQQAVDTIRNAMSYGVLDWEVTPADVRTALDALKGLSGEEQATALSQLHADGTLNKLIEETIEAGQKEGRPAYLIELSGMLRDNASAVAGDKLGEDGSKAMAEVLKTGLQSALETTAEGAKLDQLGAVLQIYTLVEGVGNAIELATDRGKRQTICDYMYNMLEGWETGKSEQFGANFAGLVNEVRATGVATGPLAGAGAGLADLLPQGPEIRVAINQLQQAIGGVRNSY